MDREKISESTQFEKGKKYKFEKVAARAWLSSLVMVRDYLEDTWKKDQYNKEAFQLNEDMDRLEKVGILSGDSVLIILKHKKDAIKWASRISWEVSPYIN